jgi:hypothetical protein
MCYLLTIGTRESQATVEAVLGENRLLMVRASRNASLRSMFPKADHLFELTNGHCSCNLVIRSTQLSVEDERAKKRGQYGRKGWSQGKIARAIADWEAAHQRQLQTRAAPSTQLCALLRELAVKPGGLRVLVHFYSGQFDTEEVRVGKRVNVAVAHFVDAAVIGEDTLAEIVPHAG